jgi:Holliday junction resolvasome RuvABC ATP-dependent DNA helicase subunit
MPEIRELPTNQIDHVVEMVKKVTDIHIIHEAGSISKRIIEGVIESILIHDNPGINQDDIQTTLNATIEKLNNDPTFEIEIIDRLSVLG